MCDVFRVFFMSWKTVRDSTPGSVINSGLSSTIAKDLNGIGPRHESKRPLCLIFNKDKQPGTDVYTSTQLVKDKVLNHWARGSGLCDPR